MHMMTIFSLVLEGLAFNLHEIKRILNDSDHFMNRLYSLQNFLVYSPHKKFVIHKNPLFPSIFGHSGGRGRATPFFGKNQGWVFFKNSFSIEYK